MKKIVAIVGSPNDEKSNTVRLITDFLENVKEYDPHIEYEVISIGKMNIKPCSGCWACMKLGKCIIDDDIAVIQDKLLSSSLIVFGSPVYVHQVSGQMKTFIDRMFIWIHMMRLLGKPAITAVTTAQTGYTPVKKYLRKTLCLLGAIPVGDLKAIAYRPGVFPKREFYKTKYRAMAIRTAKILSGRKKVFPTLMNHLYFLILQLTYRNMPQHLPFEHQYWKSKKWFGKTFGGALKLEQHSSLLSNQSD